MFCEEHEEIFEALHILLHLCICLNGFNVSSAVVHTVVICMTSQLYPDLISELILHLC